MAFAGVTIDINARKALDTLRKVNQQSQKLGQTFRRFDKSTKGLTTKFGGLSKAIATVGLVEFGRRSIQTAANFEKLNIRLKLLTQENGTFKKSLDAATEAQRLFGISSVEALEGITNITARLAPLGVGVEDIRTTFIGFNTAAKLAGASSIEASNAFRQLAQALGSGRLQGDEFRSISEQIPTILKPVADELGTTVGKLKEFSSQGKITSEVVIRALKQIEKEGAPALKALLENDPTQVFKDLSNEVVELQKTIGSALLPATKSATEGITLLTKAVNGVDSSIASAFIIVGTLTGALLTLGPILKATKASFISLLATLKAFGIILTGPVVAAIVGTGVALTALGFKIKETSDKQKAFEQVVKEGTAEQVKQQLELKREEEQRLKNLHVTGRAVAAQDKNLKRIKSEIKALQERNKEILRENENRRQTNEILEKAGTYTVAGVTYDRRTGLPISGEGVKAKPPTEDQKKGQALIKQLERQIQLKRTEDKFDRQILERRFKHIEKIKEHIKEQDEGIRKQLLEAENELFMIDLQTIQNNQLKEQNQIYNEIGQSIQNDLVANLREAINGTQTLGQSFDNVLNNLKNKLLDAALNNALSSIGDKLGGIFGQALGGGGDGKKKLGGSLGTIAGSFLGPVGTIAGGFLGNLLPFANGGNPPVGKASIVGERGPELFVPSKSGTIIPNHELGGESVTNVVTVNVDASGSSVAGSDVDAQALGSVIGAVVQAQLVKERRAGGLLS